MDFAFWIVVVAVGLVISALLISGTIRLRKELLARYRWQPEPAWPSVLVGVAKGCAILLTVTTLFSPAYYEFPDWPHKLYAIQSDGRLVEKPWGAFEYANNLAWVAAPGKVYVSQTSVTPITSNPKVRKISYGARGSIVDPEKYLAKPEHRHLWIQVRPDIESVESDVKRSLQFCQYELNNAHSTELAEFYNPLDKTQTQRFREMVEGYLNSCLAPEGMKASVENFHLN